MITFTDNELKSLEAWLSFAKVNFTSDTAYVDSEGETDSAYEKIIVEMDDRGLREDKGDSIKNHSDEELEAQRWEAVADEDFETVFLYDEELRRRKIPGEWMDIGDEPITPNNDEG